MSNQIEGNKEYSEQLSVVLPTYNERDNILPILRKILSLGGDFDLEILVIDDNSTDGTPELVKEISMNERRIRLIRRLGRSGLASAIKEGILDSSSNLIAIMDSDGQHEPIAILNAVRKLTDEGLDLVSGSRFLGNSEIYGLSQARTDGSSIANNFARFSLPKAHGHLTDYMSGFLVMNLNSCMPFIYKVDVNGFKFLYELLAVSKGKLKIKEIPLKFQPRNYGSSKLDLAIFWDFLISLLHTFSLRLIPRRAISFGLVGATGVLVQLISTHILMTSIRLDFVEALPISVVIAATSNYIINNALTFRAQRLKRWKLIRGLLKFLLVASLPVIANVGLATTFYSMIANNAIWAQLSGIFVVFIWNYAASSRFVWNTP